MGYDDIWDVKTIIHVAYLIWCVWKCLKIVHVNIMEASSLCLAESTMFNYGMNIQSREAT